MKKILLIDADSTLPNLALMKLSTYYKNKNYEVELLRLGISYYPTRKRSLHKVDTRGYDLALCSVIFNGSKEMITGDNIIYGGTGHALISVLPDYVENCDPDYSVYPDNDTSYGFISRGCIRNCSFCVVPDKEGDIHQVSVLDKIIKHKKVKFLDNNFLALPNHIDILRDLVKRGVRCEFSQGLDIRLVTPENSPLLRDLNYSGEYVFAFDSIKYKKLISKNLELLNWRRDWNFKFFVYCDADRSIKSVLDRIAYLKERKCLPYLMRNINCWSSENRDFYIDLAAWCNQPGLLKKMEIQEFIKKRYPSIRSANRIARSVEAYLLN